MFVVAVQLGHLISFADVQLLALEVLALASSDSAIRSAVAAAGFSQAFFSLLQTPSPATAQTAATATAANEPSAQSSLLARCNAAVALAKLSAVGHQDFSNEQLETVANSVSDPVG